MKRQEFGLKKKLMCPTPSPPTSVLMSHLSSATDLSLEDQECLCFHALQMPFCKAQASHHEELAAQFNVANRHLEHMVLLS